MHINHNLKEMQAPNIGKLETTLRLGSCHAVKISSAILNDGHEITILIDEDVIATCFEP